MICGINGEQVVFDEELWSGLLDYIVIKEDGAVVVVFKGGIEIALEGSFLHLFMDTGEMCKKMYIICAILSV